MLRSAVLLLPLQVLVRADNLHELHREVILRPRAAVERHGRAHRVRRHRQRLEHKPRGMRVLGVKAEDPAVLVADVLEDVQRPLRGDHLLTLAAVGKVVVLLELLELRGYLHPLQPVLRLGGSGGWADGLRLARIRELAQALLVVLDAHDLRELGILVLRWGRGKGEAGESSAAVGGGDGPMPRCPWWKNSLQRERLSLSGEGNDAERRVTGAPRAANIALGSRGSRIDPRGAVKPPLAPSLAVIALAIQGAKKPMGTSQGERGGGQKIQPAWVSSRAPCRSSASTRRTPRIAAR